MKTSKQGLALIRRIEGCRLKAYRCDAGRLTIGYGHTGDVSDGEVIDLDTAERLLRKDVSVAEAAIRSLVKIELSQGQHDALVSWLFNLGAGRLRTSELLKAINSGRLETVPAQWMRWVYVTDPITGEKYASDGLMRRRRAELELWRGLDEPVAEPDIVLLPGDISPAPPAARVVSQVLTESRTIGGILLAGLGSAVQWGADAVSALTDAAARLTQLSPVTDAIAALGVGPRSLGVALVVLGLARAAYARIDAAFTGKSG